MISQFKPVLPCLGPLSSIPHIQLVRASLLFRPPPPLPLSLREHLAYRNISSHPPLLSPLVSPAPSLTGTLSSGLWYTTATLLLSIRWRPSMMVGALRYRR